MKKLLLALVTLFLFSAPAWAAVDINNATQAELESVKGIGPKKAQAIIEYRKQHGAFESTDALEKVPGFGKTSTEKLKKDITVGNPKSAGSGKSMDRKSARETMDKTMSVGNEKAAASGKVSEEKMIKEVKPHKEKAEKAGKK